MTDTSPTPERIWIEDERPIGGSCHVYNEWSEGAEQYCVRYHSDEAVEVMIRRALKKAAEIASGTTGVVRTERATAICRLDPKQFMETTND